MTDEFEQTIRHQIAAADPECSAFVSANAGSGKTRVLTNRVARLLLADGRPEKILCITYTKAAAAEMSVRLSQLLGTWALSDHDSLHKSLCELEGANPETRTYTDEELSHARRMFARALETPGGLKIQTIHAFCETVLKRFPIEAGVPPGFEVIDDEHNQTLVEQAMDRVARRASEEPLLRDAFSHLGDITSPSILSEILHATATHRRKFDLSKATYKTHAVMLEKLADRFGIKPDTTLTEVEDKIRNFLPQNTAEDFATKLSEGGKKCIEKADCLTIYTTEPDVEGKKQALRSLFLDSKNNPRSKIAGKPLQTKYPTLETKLLEYRDTFITLLDNQNSISILENTRHFLPLSDAIADEYAALKMAQGMLDFDDLITRTEGLFSGSQHAAQWVMYKLDRGLDHILVDETQDTSPGQWDVIESPLAEFFNGKSARDNNRTFFAVGDQKQSIYSFQGADADLFDEKRGEIVKRYGGVTQFLDVPLTLSFRSTKPVLQFVDAIFAEKEAREGLGSDEPTAHGVHRQGEAGLVEVWPFIPKPTNPSVKAWDAPIDSSGEEHPTVLICEHIAATIAKWLGDDTEILTSKDRPIQAGDIIILVQSRNTAFKQMIKSLMRHDVPVAGADRINLLDDIAILDMISYARFCLLPEDDLSLAEVLKSPFFGMTEDHLFALSYDRSGVSLWESLKRAANNDPVIEKIIGDIRRARGIGRTDGPYAFFTHILDSGSPSGRHRLFSRLGTACRDTVDAFIAQTLLYEENNPRSLQGFVTWFENNASEIKRDLDQESDAVRIMTVHGAKGLEGNIVFLLDAHRKPNASSKNPYWIYPAGVQYSATSQKLPAIASFAKSSDHRNEALNQSVADEKARQFEEHRRLLYVAATRAQDRLYICPVGGQGAPKVGDKKFIITEASWYELSLLAIEHLNAHNVDIEMVNDFPWDAEGWRLQCGQTVCVEKKDQQVQSISDNLIADDTWISTPVVREASINLLSPSKLADIQEGRDTLDYDLPEDAQEVMAQAYSPIHSLAASSMGTRDRFERGTILHRLLELLPDHPVGEREGLADTILAKLAPHIAEPVRAQWRDEVLTVLNDPAFAPVFGPGSQAEVSVGGTPAGLRAGTQVNGQIDRLVVTDNEILIVDYKTNQPPPQSEDNVASSYLAQMAAYRALLRTLYPGHIVKTALLWTFDARLMTLSDRLLDQAFARSLAQAPHAS